MIHDLRFTSCPLHFRLSGMVRLIFYVVMGGLILMTACGKPDKTNSPSRVATSDKAAQQVFQVKGIVVGVKPAEKTVEIKHEEIPGYMPAMTMPFEVRDTNELAGLQPGDSVSFRMLVTDTEGWIDQIRKLAAPATNLTPASSPLRLVREVEPLSVGDPLPDYHLTNQFGQPISTAQFKGDAL